MRDLKEAGQDPNAPLNHPDMGPARGKNLPPHQGLPHTDDHPRKGPGPKGKGKSRRPKRKPFPETPMKPYPRGVLPDSGVVSGSRTGPVVKSPTRKKKTTNRPNQ